MPTLDRSSSSHKDVKCLDLDVTEGAPDGENIAGCIEEAIERLKAILTTDQISHLQDQAANARKYDQPLTTINRRTHPLHKLRSSSPIYAALSYHLINPRITKSAPPLIKLAQQAAILSHLGFGPQTPENQYAIANFAHQMANSEVILCRTLLPTIPTALTNEALTEAITKLKDILNIQKVEGLDTRTPEYVTILNTIAAFVGSEHRATTVVKKPKVRTTQQLLLQLLTDTHQNPHPSSKPPPIELQDIRPWLFPTNIAKDPDDESDKLEPNLIGDSDINGHASLSEGSLKTLHLHGHRLRLNRVLAERSQEAASELEARIALETLLNINPLALSDHAARLLWILTALLGRHFDKLAGVICGNHLEHDGSIKSIIRDGYTITITCNHPIGSNLPTLPQHVTQTTVKTDFQIDLQLPNIEKIDQTWEFIQQCCDEHKMNELLLKKEEIKAYIRQNGVNRFTETRIRGAFVQRVFVQDYDYALTQLLFNETLDVSSACLHYIAWSQEMLQEAFSSALSSLYANLIPSQHRSNNKALVGAGTAAIPFDAIRPISRWHNNRQIHIKESRGKGLWQIRHNFIAEMTLHQLVIGSAHRNTQELQRIRLTDLCLSEGLVLFRDKPTETSVYRRISVLPNHVISSLFEYIRHLKALSSYNNKYISENIMKVIRSALDGTGPLFFHVNHENTQPLQARETFKDLLPNIPPNVARALQSTHLRRYGANPLFIEAHLGHNFGGVIYSDRGMVSPSDVANHLRPFLDRFLTELGYNFDSGKSAMTFSDYANIPHFFSSDSLNKMAIEERQTDRQQLRRQLRDAINQLPKSLTINDRITQAIRSVIPSYRPSNPKKTLELTRSETLQIRNALIGTMGNDLLGIYRACRRLRKRLKQHKKINKWKIELPPGIAWDMRPPISITRANMAARDQLEIFREKLIGYCCATVAIDHYTAARCALVLWGNCPSWQEAEQWLQAAKVACTQPRDEFLLLDCGATHGTRTLTGNALIFTAAWVEAGAPERAQSTIAALLGNDVDIGTLETTARLSKSIQYSGVFEQVLNNNLPHSELPPSRIRDLLNNQVGSVGTIPDNSEYYEIDTDHSVARKSQRDIQEHFTSLRRRILPRTKKKKTRSVSKTQKAVESWNPTPPIPTLIVALRAWALHLLGPTSNLNTDGTLRVKTVSGYLNAVWAPLSNAFPRGDIFYADIEDATELIEDALSDGQEKRKNEIKRLNRFFKDMRKSYPLPNVQLSKGEGKNDEHQESEIITPAELRLTIATLEKWRLSPELEIRFAEALHQLTVALPVFYQSGMRRSELLEFMTRDYITENTLGGVLVIRPNARRGLKTGASARHILLSENKLPHVPANYSNNYYFNFMDEPSARHGAMMSLSMALKFATGSPSARLHLCRHTVATVGVCDALQISDPIAQLRFLSKLVAELGHGSLRTTLHFYAHMTHFGIAIAQQGSEILLPNKMLQNLFTESNDHIRQRKKRATEDTSLAKQYKKCFQKASKPTSKSSAYISDLPAIITAKNEQPASLKEVAMWLLRFARGMTVINACNGLNLSVETNNQLLISLEKIQKRIQWCAVDSSTIINERRKLSGKGPIHPENRKHHKRFPVSWVDQSISSLNNKVVTETFTRDIQSIRWRKRGGVFIYFGTASSEKFCSELKSILLDATPAEKKEDAGYWQIIFSPKKKLKSDANCIKLILLAILVFADLENQ